ncbi:hypothetical protein C1876_15920 [Eggerthella sinensis]|uniref:Uncharacterized protein n=1 Tax=Eggerthella sinensis TaxID=242230 RepID=A0A3N0IYI7_9ACTN|nr:hypothetical protein C1876_15920 [Eggerthella sinensis]RNM41382.1 hypothetical protein DMP09_09895 [Eggerthella sinensis]
MIYCVLICGQSYLYDYYLQEAVPFAAAFFMAIVILSRRYWDFRTLAFLGFLLTLSGLVRVFAGGVGIGVFLSYGLRLSLLVIAIKYDYANFPKRMIRLITVLAIVSMAFYFARLVIPTLFYLLPFSPFSSQGTYYNLSAFGIESFQTKGLLLVSIREGEIRNIGFYTEPGVYQAVLIGALYYLLFLREKLTTSNHEVLAEIGLLSLALITCGSTTGYLSFIIMIIGYFMMKGSAEIKNRVLFLVLLCIVLLFYDYIVRGDGSFLSESFFDKVFSEGNFSLMEGNGGVRIDSVVASLESLLKSPFGVGFDEITAAKGELAVGAGLFTTSAALGFPFIIVYLHWLLGPVFRARLGSIRTAIYLIVYILYAVSQALVLTPVLISISMYLALAPKEQPTAYEQLKQASSRI